ncbi:unnamed protein product, partial [marine sediment metagenome]
DEKYFLSSDNVDKLIAYKVRNKENGNGFDAKFHDPEKDVMSALKRGGGGCDDLVKVGTLRTHKDGEGFREIKDGTCPTIPARAREDGSGQPIIMIKNTNSKGYDEATEGDSVNLQQPNSETRRGRVGHGVAQTLDTGCNQG